MALSSLISKLKGGGDGSLGNKVARGTLWSAVSYAAGQGLRFLNNIILTRLLFPEVFGLMMLVHSICVGLELFSDVGVQQSLVQSKRGEDEDFVRTAFTVKVIRGVALTLISFILAYPAALFFEKPELLYLLPPVGLTSTIRSFASVRELMAARNLEVDKLTKLRLAEQIVAIVAMTAYALISPTIWSLVFGTLVGAATHLVISHVLFPSKLNRFGWDKAAADEMLKFGRWIMVSTMLTYLVSHGDALLTGRLMTAAQLGFFSLALNLARLVQNAMGTLQGQVFFPAYAAVMRDDPKRLSAVVRKTRLAILGASAVGYLPLVVLGSWAVDLVYDDRYQDAGWMVQTLSCGVLTQTIFTSYNGILHAQGKSYESSVLQFFEVGAKFLCLGIGYYFFGLPGLIVGLVFNWWLAYPACAYIMRRAGVWQPKLDAVAMVCALLITALFFSFGPAQVSIW